MPKPGDRILLSATLLALYGVDPTTHSCQVEIRNSLGAVVISKKVMTNVVGTIYTYVWDTSVGGPYPVAPYQAVYYAVLDGADAPEVAEVFYLEYSGITPAVESMIEQIWYMTFCNKEESFEYDSQGKTTKVTARYSETSDFTVPLATFENTYTYNADNSLSNWDCIRVVP